MSCASAATTCKNTAHFFSSLKATSTTTSAPLASTSATLPSNDYRMEVITDPEELSRRIRIHNDRLRKSGIGGETYLTHGIASLDGARQAQVLDAVRAFDDWSEDNDPWQQHDCALFEVDGLRVMFKIDLYEKSVVKGSAVNGSLSRCNIPHVPLGSADTPRRHRNSRRSNRPSWASFAARIACRRIYTGMHRLASFLSPDCRTVGT